MIWFGWVLRHTNNFRLCNAKLCLCIYIKYIWFGLVGIYRISTIVGYLIPNPLNTYCCIPRCIYNTYTNTTREERHNSYYANHPQRAVHLVMFKISVSRDPKNPTSSFNGRNQTFASETQFSASMVQSQLPTDSSKFSISQDHLFRAWRHPHSSDISCLGVY